MIEVSQDRVGSPVYTRGVADGADPVASIPAALAASVQAAQDHGGASKMFYVPTMIVSTLGRANEPGLAVGTPLGNYYQLYYLFPMQQEQQTLQLVQRTLIGAGLALIVLLALIASLVTRWVVIPVRHAAQAAQRLTAGRLEERMRVRGADDLAALATSFNDMAASLQDKLRELEELSKLQRQFVSDVSHELRTPLTTIKMAAEVLLEAKDTFDVSSARSAELLQGQLERFQELLEDLLEISRHDANAATLDADSVDISDLARRAADDAQQLAERRGCRIEFRLPAEPCMADADRRRVERILRNLLVNAVEHGEGHDVVVTVAGDRDAVAVAVRDHGVGLKPGRTSSSLTASGAPTRPGPARPAGPGSAWPSRWRTRSCTADGCRPGACWGRGRSSGSPSPGPPGRSWSAPRYRWSPTTPTSSRASVRWFPAVSSSAAPRRRREPWSTVTRPAHSAKRARPAGRGDRSGHAWLAGRGGGSRHGGHQRHGWPCWPPPACCCSPGASSCPPAATCRR